MSLTDKYVPPEENASNPRIVLVGESPGRNEALDGEPFVGQAGSLLDDALRDAGIRRSDICLINVVPYKAPANEFKAHPRKRVREGLQELDEWLQAMSPNIIVALGNEAAAATTYEWPSHEKKSSRVEAVRYAKGVRERRGYIFEGEAAKVLATVHPAFAQRAWVPNRTLLSDDLKKAKKRSRFAEIRRPGRNVEVIS